MADITQAEKEELFLLTRHQLGSPVRSVELTNEILNSLLKVSLLEYSGYINNWLVEHQWMNLFGVTISTTDFTFNFLNQSLDFENRFTYAYSKIAGLQAAGPWELKRDFIELSGNQQTYIIPAGRELNEILWFTPPPLYRGFQEGYYGSFQAISPAIGNNVSGAFNPTGHYIMPAFDYALRLTDVNIKNRMIFGEMIYKITGGANGTKVLHLMPTPGGRFDFKNAQLNGWRVWYYYYDVGIDDDLAQCLQDNPDIIKLPTQVPIGELEYSRLNSPAKNDVRKLLLAKSKQTLGLYIRGKFSGALNIPDGENITMDYSSISDEGKEEQEKIFEELKERLERMSPQQMLERAANQAENLNKALSLHPFQTPIIII